MTHVGKSIKIALIRHDKSQKWLAEQLGVSPQFVYRISNKPEATTTLVGRLAKIFDMKASEFLELGEANE